MGGNNPETFDRRRQNVKEVRYGLKPPSPLIEG